MMQQSFKKLLENEKRIVGMFVNTACPEFLEIAAYTGYKFVIIDNEHGCWDGETNSHLIRAADAAGIVPLVRVSQIDETEEYPDSSCCHSGFWSAIFRSSSWFTTSTSVDVRHQ